MRNPSSSSAQSGLTIHRKMTTGPMTTGLAACANQEDLGQVRQLMRWNFRNRVLKEALGYDAARSGAEF
jgi:hypothetical protein